MHVLKYCCVFDNSFLIREMPKSMTETMKPQSFGLGFFTNHLKLVNSVPDGLCGPSPLKYILVHYPRQPPSISLNTMMTGTYILQVWIF